ncbi:MAG: chalcone isomerase family protein [Halioglobus sp.]
MRALVSLILLIVALPVVANGDALTKVGEAKLKVLFWDVYNSTLYSDNGRYREGQVPLRLDIQYLLDIESNELVARTAQEWDELGLEHENREEWLTNLSNLWPDVSKDDVLTIELDDNNRSTFYRNGELLGTIEDRAFGASFIDIWLSPDTTRPKLRTSLIGAE